MRIPSYLLVFAAAGLALASCATTPKPASTVAQEPAPVQPAQPAQPAPAAAPAVPAPNDELAQAQSLKAEIDKYGLANGSLDVYQQGVASLNAGQQAIGTDNAAAKSKLDESVASFQKVLDSGFPAALNAQGQKVASAKSAAQGVKADRAASDVYNQAAALEQQAGQKQSAKDYAGAYDLLVQAYDGYNKAAATANAMKAAAQSAFDSATAQINDTTNQIQALQQGLSSSSVAGGQ